MDICIKNMNVLAVIDGSHAQFQSSSASFREKTSYLQFGLLTVLQCNGTIWIFCVVFQIHNNNKSNKLIDAAHICSTKGKTGAQLPKETSCILSTPSPQKHKHHDHAMQTACLLNFSDDSPLPEGLHRHAPGSAVLSPPFLFTVFSFDHRTP